MKYSAADGTLKRPIMIHRALLGSLERFLGVLIEYHGGEFPLWLVPTQVVVLPLTNKEDEPAKEIYNLLIEKEIRTKIDNRSKKVNSRIRDWELLKVPYMLVIGPKEAEEKTISVREHKRGVLGNFTPQAFIELLKKEEKWNLH